jgi:hypothetical protein
LVGLSGGELLGEGLLVDALQSSLGVEVEFRGAVVGVYLAFLGEDESGRLLGLEVDIVVALQTQNFRVNLIGSDIEKGLEVTGGHGVLPRQYLKSLLLDHYQLDYKKTVK